MEFHYRPQRKGIEVSIYSHSDMMLGFILRGDSISLDLLFISLHLCYFDRVEYEREIRFFSGGENES